MVGFGIGWALLTEQDVASMDIDYCDSRCTFLLYETLRALRRAADLEGLSKRQIEDLFYNNAIAFVHGPSATQPDRSGLRAAEGAPK